MISWLQGPPRRCGKTVDLRSEVVSLGLDYIIYFFAFLELLLCSVCCLLADSIVGWGRNDCISVRGVIAPGTLSGCKYEFDSSRRVHTRTVYFKRQIFILKNLFFDARKCYNKSASGRREYDSNQIVRVNTVLKVNAFSENVNQRFYEEHWGIVLVKELSCL